MPSAQALLSRWSSSPTGVESGRPMNERGAETVALEGNAPSIEPRLMSQFEVTRLR